jgi:hypothetical protein
MRGRPPFWRRRRRRWAVTPLPAAPTPPFDLVVEVRVRNLLADADAKCGLTYRAGAANEFWAAYVNRATSQAVLSRYVGGVETAVATAAWTAVDEVEFRVFAQGWRHRVYVNRVLVIDATSADVSCGRAFGLYSRDTTVTLFGHPYGQGL